MFIRPQSSKCLFNCLILSLLVGLSPLSASADNGALPWQQGPLRVRNLNPVVQLYGLPRMVGARVLDDRLEASMNVEAGNNFQSDRVGDTFVFLDGESYTTSARIRGGVGHQLELGLEIPWVVHAPGSLDGVVDEFHELFGLPDGERSLASRYRLDYLVRSGGVTYADFDESQSDLGDIRAYVGWQVMDGRHGALTLRSQIKFPTGAVDKLSGSEATDVAVWGEYEYATMLRNTPMRLTLGGGMAYLGEGKLVPEAQVRWAHFGHLGLQFEVHRRVALHAQLDAHSPLLETGNPLIADGGVLGTLGARIAFTNRTWFDFALIEDLKNESASDVIFQFMLATQF